MTTQRMKRIENIKMESRDPEDKMRRSNMVQVKLPRKNKKNRRQELFEETMTEFSRTDK